MAREKIPGQYVWNEGEAGTLDVNADGTYHYWISETTPRLENYGTWELDTVSNAIIFEDFRFLTDGLPGGRWRSRLRSEDNEVHLMYARDSNIYLKKIE